MINNDQRSNEVKIVKISSKLFQKSPSMFCAFSKPRRINFEEKEKFLTFSGDQFINTKYERKEQLNRIIKLYNQSKVNCIYNKKIGMHKEKTRIHQ